MLARQFSKVSGIPVSHIMICATHSHTGPSFDNVIRNYFHDKAVAATAKDPQEQYDYPDFLVEKLVKASARERETCAGTVKVGIAKEEGLSFNRRYHMRNGKVAFNPGQIEHEYRQSSRANGPRCADAVHSRRDDKQALAGVDRVRVSLPMSSAARSSAADYPFFFSSVAARIRRNFISPFARAHCGDINHINAGVKWRRWKGFDRAEQIGAPLGRTVIAAQKGFGCDHQAGVSRWRAGRSPCR